MPPKEYPLIEVKELIHSYNGKKVLDIPVLSFSRGKIYSLLGPNGSGKSTLLNILGLLLKPSSGKVLIHDQDVYANPELIQDMRTRMTTVIQNPILFDMSVEKNVAYGLRIRGTAPDEREKIEEEIKKLPVEEREKAKEETVITKPVEPTPPSIVETIGSKTASIMNNLFELIAKTSLNTWSDMRHYEPCDHSSSPPRGLLSWPLGVNRHEVVS